MRQIGLARSFYRIHAFSFYFWFFSSFFFFVRLTYIYIRCTSSGGKNNDPIMYTVTVPGMR